MNWVFVGRTKDDVDQDIFAPGTVNRSLVWPSDYPKCRFSSRSHTESQGDRKIKVKRTKVKFTLVPSTSIRLDTGAGIKLLSSG